MLTGTHRGVLREHRFSYQTILASPGAAKQFVKH